MGTRAFDPAPGTFPWDPIASGRREADAQATADPPVAAGSDGWSPASIKVVESRNPPSFERAAIQFALGGVDEAPGQRLSTAQIDALAPYYSHAFRVDEAWVRTELAKVYVYVGGPAKSSGQALTVGHHVFVPDESGLRRILSPVGRRWLTHELAHTMQFLAYDNGNSHRFLASYMKSIVLGHAPNRPGAGSGGMVWGAAFTGWRTHTEGYDKLGAASTSIGDRIGFSVLPAAMVGLPLGLSAGGLLAATRSGLNRGAPELARRVSVLGSRSSVGTALGIVTAPLLAGSMAGVYADKIGKRPAQLLGAGAAGGAALLTLAASGALAHRAGGGSTLTSRLLAGGAALFAAQLGWMTATLSANTIGGWAQSSNLLGAHETNGVADPNPSFVDGLHDAHWAEIDAESVAQQFVTSTDQHFDNSAWAGNIPTNDDTGRDVADWGIWNPLLLGIPAAAIAGTGTLATRTGVTLVRDGVGGQRPIHAIGNAIAQLTSARKGVINSMGTGAAMTLAPLVAGGLAGPAAARLGLDPTTARFAGAGVAAVTTGTLLTMLLGGRGSGLLKTTPKIIAGMVVGGAVGLLSSSVAIDASHPTTRSYRIGNEPG